jgi:hypothetical protein
MNPTSLLRQSGGFARRGIGLGLDVSGRIAGFALERVRGGGAGDGTDGGGQPPKADMDDVTLARKVETKAFRHHAEWRANIDVNAVEGVVFLHGEVRHPEEVEAVEAAVRAVPEVRGVENLLHLVKTPAPTRADTPVRQQRTRSSTKRPTPSRRRTGRITDDRTDAIAPGEPSPVEHARSRTGRTPAPFGSHGGGEGEQMSHAIDDPERQLPPADG